MRLLLFIFLVTVGCNRTNGGSTLNPKTSEPLAVCEDERAGVYGESSRRVGPTWIYTYRGETYVATEVEALNPNSPVYHSNEQVLSSSGSDLFDAKTSLRFVTLTNPDGQVVISTQVFCSGRFAAISDFQTN